MVEDRAEAVFPGLVPPCREQRVIIVDKAARVTQVEPISDEPKTVLSRPLAKSEGIAFGPVVQRVTHRGAKAREDDGRRSVLGEHGREHDLLGRICLVVTEDRPVASLDPFRDTDEKGGHDQSDCRGIRQGGGCRRTCTQYGIEGGIDIHHPMEPAHPFPEALDGQRPDRIDGHGKRIHAGTAVPPFVVRVGLGTAGECDERIENFPAILCA